MPHDSEMTAAVNSRGSGTTSCQAHRDRACPSAPLARQAPSSARRSRDAGGRVFCGRTKGQEGVIDTKAGT
jgi:hypothetical protein